MKRTLIALTAGLALLTVACGGDKKPASTSSAPTEQTAAKTPAAGKTAATTKTAATGKTATPKASTASGKTVSGLLGTIFGGALGAPQTQTSPELGEGDPDLLKLLPPDGALPDGYAPVGAYTFRAPDGISDTGGIDMAAAVAMAGSPASSGAAPDFSKVGILMALVMRPDDLQDLGEAFDAIRDLDDDDLQDALGGAEGLDGILSIENTRVFETDGLGDGNAGIEMTLDMSGLGSLFGAGGIPQEDGAPDLTELKLTMRLYLFARGDYAGGLLRMAFSDTLPDDFDEVALAKLIDDNLKSAP